MFAYTLQNMGTTPMIRADLLDTVHRQRGAAVIVLLFALSIFSVLALSVLRNSPLEMTLRTSDNPDLHVVLYTGGAGSPQVVGRLNLPTMFRLQEAMPDPSVEIRAPGPVGAPLTGELEPGWAYAVQLMPNVRVCCDSGDAACNNITWDQQVPEGSISPAIEAPLQSTDLEPNASVESPFLVRATRVPEGAQPETTGAAAVSCRLDTRERNLATASVALRPGADASGRVNRVSAGSVELHYKAPK